MRIEWGPQSRAEVSSAFAQGAVAAIAVGSLEQHGDHLPTDTDTYVARTVTAEAARRARRTVVELPAFPYGISAYHARFGGTLFVTSPTLLAAIGDICESVRRAGAHALAIINGHGGNEGLLHSAAQEVSDDGFAVTAFSYWEVAAEKAHELFAFDKGSVGHAGQAETALVLALRDGSLPHESPRYEPVDPDILPMSRVLGVSGVIGNPAAASRSIGQAFFEAVVDGVAQCLDQL